MAKAVAAVREGRPASPDVARCLRAALHGGEATDEEAGFLLLAGFVLDTHVIAQGKTWPR